MRLIKQQVGGVNVGLRCFCLRKNQQHCALYIGDYIRFNAYNFVFIA
jgi:hypothetical protein